MGIAIPKAKRGIFMENKLFVKEMKSDCVAKFQKLLKIEAEYTITNAKLFGQKAIYFGHAVQEGHEKDVKETLVALIIARGSKDAKSVDASYRKSKSRYLNAFKLAMENPEIDYTSMSERDFEMLKAEKEAEKEIETLNAMSEKERNAYEAKRKADENFKNESKSRKDKEKALKAITEAINNAFKMGATTDEVQSAIVGSVKE